LRLIRTPHAPGKTKFGENKPWTSAKLSKFSKEENEQLNWLSGHSIAQNTWRTYGTAGKLFMCFCKEKNIAPELPAAADTITRFILWLSFERKVSQATISVYLSGLRQLHLQHGVDCTALRSDFVKMLLQGKKNSECRDSQKAAPQRQPATTPILRKLREALEKANMDVFEKRLIWTTSTILFFGALRSNELLCINPAKFDPRFCVCAEDIAVATNRANNEKKLVITVKVPKEEKSGANQTIEIFPAKNPQLCAVASWEKWLALGPPLEAGQPALRKRSGAPFTQADLNSRLKQLLPNVKISSHSFRIGAATEMGLKGYANSDIKLAGRWSSGCFERYVRLGKTRRASVAASFSKLV